MARRFWQVGLARAYPKVGEEKDLPFSSAALPGGEAHDVMTDLYLSLEPSRLVKLFLTVHLVSRSAPPARC